MHGMLLEGMVTHKPQGVSKWRSEDASYVPCSLPWCLYLVLRLDFLVGFSVANSKLAGPWASRNSLSTQLSSGFLGFRFRALGFMARPYFNQ